MPNSSSTPRTNSQTEALAERLYSAHHSRLLVIAMRNSSNKEEAEEALHDAFILFIDHFKPDSAAPPLAWLTLTLKRRCWELARNQRRKLLREIDPSLEDASHTLVLYPRAPEENLEVAEEMATLGARLSRLKPDQRTALVLFAIGYSYHEIRERTGWSDTKINRCIRGGRAALREDGSILGDECG